MTPHKFTIPAHLCICRDERCSIPFGTCHCGCGQKTNIADHTYQPIGWIRGRPTRFIIGHANRLPRLDFSDAAPFKIDGVYCKLLGLTRGLCAIVNAEQYEELKQRRYYALKTIQGFYAVRHSKGFKKQMGPHLYLHRDLLGLPVGDPTQGDHDNGCTLDCRMNNLRPATGQQNHYNCKTPRTNKSGRSGVHFRKDRGNFTVQLKHDGICHRRGGFATFEAACAYRTMLEEKYHGEFSRHRKKK